MSAKEERTLLALLGVLFLTIFEAPFAGSSILNAAIALLSDI